MAQSESQREHQNGAQEDEEILKETAAETRYKAGEEVAQETSQEACTKIAYVSRITQPAATDQAGRDDEPATDAAAASNDPWH